MSDLGDLLDDAFVRPIKQQLAKQKAEAAAKQAEVDRVAADAAAKVRADEHAAIEAQLKETKRKLAAAEAKVRAEKIQDACQEIARDREVRGKKAFKPAKLQRRGAELVAKRAGAT